MRPRAEHDRRFGYAVAASLAVHALALYGGLPLLRESLQDPVAPPPLVTRLVELPKPAEPAPPEEKKPAEAKKPEPRRESRKVAPPLPSPRPAPVAPAPAPAEPPAAVPPVAAPSPPPAPAPQPPAVDTRAAEAATAAQYRLQLIAYAQRNKPPYPRIARENNWTGEVVLEITVRADGRAELGLRRGSGHEVLDRLALDTYQQALRAVPVPPSLQGRQVKLQPLRLIYNLTD
jgi:periplasmic protein TonB